jgi:hypothetical protein
MREISIDQPDLDGGMSAHSDESDAAGEAGDGAEAGEDANPCVEASSGILVLDRAAFSPEAEARARRRRRWRNIGLWIAALVAALVPGIFALLSSSGSQIYERRRLVAACESPSAEHLTRVLACIDLCGRGSGAHCVKKGDLYTAAQDASSAARAYREACELGELRACRMASPPR